MFRAAGPRRLRRENCATTAAPPNDTALMGAAVAPPRGRPPTAPRRSPLLTDGYTVPHYITPARIEDSAAHNGSTETAIPHINGDYGAAHKRTTGPSRSAPVPVPVLQSVTTSQHSTTKRHNKLTRLQ